MSDGYDRSLYQLFCPLLCVQATGEVVQAGDQIVQQVLEGPGGDQQTVFVLKVRTNILDVL